MQLLRIFVMAALLACGLATQGLAQCGNCIPDVRECLVDPVLIGNTTGNQIGSGFNVTVRTITQAPVPGVTVYLAFIGSAQPYSSQNSGTTVDCAARVISKVTDSMGHAVFNVRMASYDNSPGVEVEFGGLLFGTVPARSTDFNSNGQTDAGDWNTYRDLYLSGVYHAEIDYNNDSVINVSDTNIFRDELFSGASYTVCP